MTWSYAYGPAVGSFAPCNGCVNTKTVTVTDPLGNVNVDTFGTEYAKTDGLLLGSVQKSSSGTVLRSTSFTYALPTAGPYPATAGGTNAPADSMSRLHTPQSQRAISQQGMTFTSTVSGTGGSNGFDAFARATGITRSNSRGVSRFDTTTYADNTTLWVLGQIASRMIAGTQAAAATFYAATALPSATYKFGKLQGRYAFNPDGTLYSVTDPLNHATVYGNYMRGLARSIAYADGTSIGATVDNIGNVASVTNEVGAIWRYTYDAMGRIASATPPGGYNTKYFSFFQVASPEYGLEASH
jgi:YD repeat-containing protein